MPVPQPQSRASAKLAASHKTLPLPLRTHFRSLLRKLHTAWRMPLAAKLLRLIDPVFAEVMTTGRARTKGLWWQGLR